MGVTGLALAFLLALAVPASIAPTSLLGAYVVLGLLSAVAVGVARYRRPGYLPGVGVGVVVYAALVAVIHFAAS